MIVASSIILQNILYLAGAVALIIILSVAVTLRHRRPVSVESHMESFNKGLKALAPDAPPAKRKSRSDKTATLPPPAAAYRPSSVQPIVAKPKSEPVAAESASSTPTTLEAETG
ncbi:MAG TPA: hypothetical protein VKV06_09375 [Acidimicrobiales bacterium]|nr:hypothetical protein [Acidimicrobiales bacterium]